MEVEFWEIFREACFFSNLGQGGPVFIKLQSGGTYIFRVTFLRYFLKKCLKTCFYYAVDMLVGQSEMSKRGGR